MDKSREAFEKLFDEDNVLEDTKYNRAVAHIIWQAACAHQKEVDAGKFKALELDLGLTKIALQQKIEQLVICEAALKQAIREQGE
jgi:hypothetical protein